MIEFENDREPRAQRRASCRLFFVVALLLAARHHHEAAVVVVVAGSRLFDPAGMIIDPTARARG